MKRWLPAAAIVVVVDQLTKAWAQRALADRVIDLPGPSAFRLSYNTGVAFGQGRGWGVGPLIAALGMAIIAILVLRVAKGASRRRQVIVGLVIGGAVGNLIDRVVQAPGWFRGPVVDFIQLVPWFPIFNVADVAITLGGLALVLSMAGDPSPADGADDAHRGDDQPDRDTTASDESEPEEHAASDRTDAADDSESAER